MNVDDETEFVEKVGANDVSVDASDDEFPSKLRFAHGDVDNPGAIYFDASVVCSDERDVVQGRVVKRVAFVLRCCSKDADLCSRVYQKLFTIGCCDEKSLGGGGNILDGMNVSGD